MKKSIIFLLNGLGIEKPGSYSISIDQCMPNLSRVKETSFFKTGIISSLEYKTAYQNFFLGNTYNKELSFIKDNILNNNLVNNPIYQQFKNTALSNNGKIHVFVEPKKDKVVEQINELIAGLNLGKDKKVYLHLLLPQQSVNEYNYVINVSNYIQYHIDTHIDVGFIMGKEFLNEELTNQENDMMKKMLFACSCERWTDMAKKFKSLQDSNIRPCKTPGFCATNECAISEGDTILFFNTTGTNYDNIINAILLNAKEVFKKDSINLSFYSLLKLNSKYNIISFFDSIEYDNSLPVYLKKYNKKCLIITAENKINLVNFYANGMKHINNPDISFMKIDDTLYNPQVITNIIDNSNFDLIIFDFHLDTDHTINDLKAQLERIDKILGNVSIICENKHSLFISSLYGIKKTMPLADYNGEQVTIDYELQIPIFLYDYSFPRGKYNLAGGDTNRLLETALFCISNDPMLQPLIYQKGLITNLLNAFKK